MTRGRRAQVAVFSALVAVAALAMSGCGGGGGSASPTAARTGTAHPASPASTPGTPAPGVTPGSPLSFGGTPALFNEACKLRTSMEGRALTPGASFRLNAQDIWQLCLGGVAAGSGEKYLYRSADGGSSWTLISQTTLGDATPPANVGAFPNGNGVAVMIFRDASIGWVGLTSPGQNLFRSTDGGVTWTPNTDLPPGLPVTGIIFTNATNGSLQTPQGPWHTTDGGDHWVAGP